MDKSKMMMGIIIALLVLLLGTVIGVAVYLINLSDDDAPNWNDPRPPALVTVLMPEDVRWVPIGEFVANLHLGPGGRSDNVLVDVEIGLNATVDEDELEEFYRVLNNSIPLARNVVLDAFVSRTYEEVRTLEGRHETREIIKYALQEAFGSNLIVSISFAEFNAVRGR